ncbi:hypothetical protein METBISCDRAFT_18077 [Metschnikowia bicuspidata]|uniref:Uncharacterized protein n=1 Tax=Metschnikowia bicuspidata TaxID=27322 RepID=A0A4P9ZAB7_9ASCO|nr:hypothetical protein METBISCDRAFT_18077 [Metschnikowia bicuspidata]
MRRSFLPEDAASQQYNHDVKIPFPQAKYFPPRLSMRGIPLKAYGTLSNDAPSSAPEVHLSDPRFLLQDVSYDDKRFKNYYGYAIQLLLALNPAGGGMIGMPNPNHAMTSAPMSMNGMVPHPHQQSSFPGKLEEFNGLVSPILPAQMLQIKEDEQRKTEAENQIQSKCSRCQKEFTQSLMVSKDLFLGKFGAEPKIFKLCDHCRDLQRERLRRWQKKAKEKQGACRRCGHVIPIEQQKYVLCPQCRRNLRMRKANRAAQGKCVHCSGPINFLIVGEDADENGRSPSVVGATYKLCQRCRENDKIRRTNLERMGNCNRCAKALSTEEQGCHKVCLKCRQKKKKIGSVSLHSGFPGVPSMVAIDGMQGVPQKNVVPMNYVPVDQSLMVGSTSVSLMVVGGHMSQQEYVPPYTQVISLLDMYKAQLAQYQMQPQQDQPAQGQYLLQRPQLNR